MRARAGPELRRRPGPRRQPAREPRGERRQGGKPVAGAPDWLLLLVVLLLLGVGLVMVASASRGVPPLGLYYFKRQALFIAVGSVALLVCALIPPWVWQKLAKPGYVFVLILLVLVLIPGIGSLGGEGAGARRWFALGSTGFNLQPSELMKIALALFLADYCARRQAYLTSLTQGFLPLMVHLGLVAGLIVMEPDLGTAVVIGAMVLAVLLVAGVRISHLLGLTVVGILGTAVFALQGFRLERMKAWLDPFSDPLGVGMQTIQSLYALGLGGPFGRGLAGSQQYVFEQHTDFIFAIIGQEFGLVGTLLVLGLFALFLWRGLTIARAADTPFGTYAAVGLTSVITLQALFNMAVVTAVAPNKGIPLPFISYGGSSLIFSMAAVGILLSISRHARL